ncbi:MAG: hypothetical protein EXS16_03845 [Gemmataceae bacterium]|nr:hypothetical protein [Gemmataceae bacterium]
MATVAPTPSSSVLARLRDSAQTLVAGLAWAGVMLIVFRYWIQIKHLGRSPILANLFLIAGLAVLGLAGWQAFVLWLRQDTPDQKAETLASQRRLLSLVLLGGGFALIVLAFVLGVGKKVGGSYGFMLDNFGESAGLLLFGITGLFYGWTLQQPADESASPIAFLIDKAPLLKMAMIVLMVVSMGVFVYVIISNRDANRFLNYTPQLLALLFLSITAGTGFFRLNADTHDESSVRFFVLIFGGLTGLNLFVLSAGLAYLWRDDVAGGETAWHGENNWRLWLCAYTMIAGLVTMMVSLNLAKTDVRHNAGLRRAMYGYNAILQGLLLLGILIVLNFIVAKKYPFTYDWTKTRGAYALSESGQNLVKGLKKEINLLVLMAQTHPAHKDTKILLDNCKALNNKFKVNYISPDTEHVDFDKLIRIFPQIQPEPGAGDIGRGVLVVYGPMPTDEGHKVPYTFIRDRRLIKQERPQGPGGKASSQYLGEVEILKEVKFLSQDRVKHKIYVLQGNEEPDINNDENASRMEIRHGFQGTGLGILVEKLKNENFDVVGLTFDPLAKEEKQITPVIQATTKKGEQKRSIPTDCKTLIVAGVSRSLSAETINAIDDYLSNGGKVLAFLDVIAEDDYSKLRNTGLEPMLKRFGVEVTDEYALRVAAPPFGGDPTMLIALTPAKSANILARQFTQKQFLLRKSARGLKVSTHQRYKAEPILQVFHLEGSPFIAETNPVYFKDPVSHVIPMTRDPLLLRSKAPHEPMSVGLAVTDGEKPALVVFGDTEWITSRDLQVSRSSVNAFALVLGSIEWMAGREDFVGPQPKVTTSFAFEPGVNFGRMVFLPGWIMFLAFILLGITVWIIRRR